MTDFFIGFIIHVVFAIFIKEAFMSQSLFGLLPDKTPVTSYKISSGTLEARILDYGASLQGLDYLGIPLILSHPNIEGYLEDTTYQGALVGRNAGRISEGKLIIDGHVHILAQNNKSCNLHGGGKGFDKQLWTVKGHRADSIELGYHSLDGEEGFPGAVDITVCYTIKGSALHINYSASCTKTTLINPTQHTYFNLSGTKSSILNHVVRIDADSFAALGEDFAPLTPTLVEGTPFDFKSPKAVGRDISQPQPQLQLAGGYDHPFFLSTKAPQITAHSPESGITLNISTDRSAVIFYTGNFLKDRFLHRQGLCFETQECSNACFHPSLARGAVFTEPDKPYTQHTVWEFSKI